MKIIYDAQIFSLQKYGGVSRYFSELIFQFRKDPNIEIMLPRMLDQNYYLGNNNRLYELLNKYNFRGKKRLINFININLSKHFLRNNDFDIFHPTYYDPYFLKSLKGKPFILTVHDMIHEKFTDLFPEKDINIKNKKELILRAEKIIAISNQTKQDIIDIIGADAEKIEVIYQGYRLNNGKISPLFQTPRNYILFVGDRRHYKNFVRFVNAFAQVHKKKSNLKLVCVGDPFSKSEEILIMNLGIYGVTTVLSVNDSELASLYKNAELFVFPSLYEGFGIPILEAMASGCPIAISNSSCFPEIAEDAAEYFDPYDEGSIAKAIETLLNNTKRRIELISRGLEHVKKFSWEKTVLQTKQLYKTL